MSKEKDKYKNKEKDKYKNKEKDTDREKRNKETTCFIDQHSFNGITSQPCNGIPRVIFEDVTSNHNKVLIFAQTLTPAPCISTLTIETRDEIISRVLNPSLPLIIQVEDLKRITLLCQGNPTGVCEVAINFTKTFFICCPTKTNDQKSCCCTDENKVDTHTKNKKVESTCFIDQHQASIVVQQPCNGNTTVVFEDLTDNHNKFLVQINNNTPAPCLATLIIETDDRTITRELPNQVGQTNATFGIEVADVRRVSIRCQGNPAGACTLDFRFQKTFCICGTDQEKKPHKS
jgi:hypothetical protein